MNIFFFNYFSCTHKFSFTGIDVLFICFIHATFIEISWKAKTKTKTQFTKIIFLHIYFIR